MHILDSDRLELTIKPAETRSQKVVVLAKFRPCMKCLEALKKANKTFRRLLRKMTLREPVVVVHLQKALLNSHLKYAAAAWAD